MKDFIIIDTEGNNELTEIAILDNQGQVIYEALVKVELDAEGPKINAKSLKEIMTDFLNLAQSKLIICHYAAHDLEVLKNSCKKVKIPWPTFTFDCTYELSKRYFPGLQSYSLDYLSKYLNLQVDNHTFNQNFAHSAKYDAQFTYQLYKKIRSSTMKTLSPPKPNPFGTSRVDTPFQEHADFKEIYQKEFDILKSILTEIKQDPNHQTKGAVVIGEAGSGKTHLMMRLAQELLNSHRLLFIRQPNNPHAVLYHIYSRILESLVEIIPNSTYSQLEYLLAQSFSKIIREILQKKDKLTQRGETILKNLSADPLNIYQVLGTNTGNKIKNWQWIEKLTLEWWSKTYGFSGYAAAIIQGLIKFCSYSDLQKRNLVRRWLAGNPLELDELDSIKLENWSDNISQEDFSLEAIAVFSKLSIIDEPLIIIFDQLEGLKYHEQLLFRFGEAIKEIFTHAPNSLIILNLFPDRWQHFQTFFDDAIIDRLSQYKLRLDKPSEAQLQTILAVKAKAYEIAIETFFTPAELQVILNQSSIRGVLNWASHYYRHKTEGIALPISTTSFEEEIRAELQKLKDNVAWLTQQITGLEQPPPTVPVLETAPVETTPLLQPTENDEQQLSEYLNQQQAQLEQTYDKNVIINDFDDIGKVATIVAAFKTFKTLETDCLRLGKRKLPEHLLIKTAEQSFVVGFLQVGTTIFPARIKNFNELVINYKDIRFGLFRDNREPLINGKVGKSEIEKLNNASNGKFIYMDKADRIAFELIYKLIVDIQNQDFEMPLGIALPLIETQLSHHWLIKILKKAVPLGSK